jgi:hypothetical protein
VLPSPQCSEDADDQKHRAPAEVADEVQRRDGTLAGAADGVQQTADGNVVDVVTGLQSARTLWPQPVIRA